MCDILFVEFPDLSGIPSHIKRRGMLVSCRVLIITNTNANNNNLPLVDSVHHRYGGGHLVGELLAKLGQNIALGLAFPGFSQQCLYAHD